jgi:hypothetical protein
MPGSEELKISFKTGHCFTQNLIGSEDREPI